MLVLGPILAALAIFVLVNLEDVSVKVFPGTSVSAPLALVVLFVAATGFIAGLVFGAFQERKLGHD